MTLHLVELPLSLPALNSWARPRTIARGPFDEGLALHHLLGEVFGPAVLQPFRLMVAPRAQCGTLYAYADRPAPDLRRVPRPPRVLTPCQLPERHPPLPRIAQWP